MKLFVIVLSMFLFAGSVHGNDTEVLKQDITKLAKKFTTDTANAKQVRAQLDPMIQKLIQGQPIVTVADWAQYAPGAWRQIWSDEADNSPPGSLERDLNHVYQYVTPQGRAVNFGARILPNKSQVVFALEAVGAVAGNKQTTTILNAFSRGDAFEKGEYLSVLASDILDEKYEKFNGVAAGKFPNGPIGAEADLTILFLDDEMKIGTSPNVYTGEIELFILERISSI